MGCSQPGSSVHGFPRQEYWSGLLFLLQGIFPTQGLNPCLLHWQVDSLPPSHQGSPLGNLWFGLVTKSCSTLVAPWTVAHQAPLSMGFSRQEYWSRLPFPSPEDLPNPGIEPRSPTLQADSLPTELREALQIPDLERCDSISHLFLFI